MSRERRGKSREESGHNVWRSYSDMMSGLLLLFILIMAVCLMQAQKNYAEKLAEQAKQIQTQNQLEQSQSQLEQSQSTVDEQQAKLDEQEATLAEQASALEQLQKALENQQLALVEKESELDAFQVKLDDQDKKLKDQEKQLADSQAKLDNANRLMDQQQQRIDQIIGVKADLIAALDREFRANQINVEIDSQTGAILLNSSVLFDYNESELTFDGSVILEEVLPVYCSVLLSPEYADYVAEVIIDGYTDTTGDYVTNLDLSQRRAFAVAGYLLENMYSFLTPEECEALMSRLTVNGKSFSHPIMDQSGNIDMDASRRVEIKFRLRDEEMMSELQAIIADADAARTEASADGAAQEDGGSGPQASA